MPLIAPPPGPGQIARVRQRQYLVEEVVPPPSPGDSTLVRLACVEDDAQGQPLEVLWENEVDAEVLTGEAWHELTARGFDPPRLFSAYLHTLRWNCVTATDPRLFQSPFRAGIRLDAYQLEPLRKALLLPRVNLFIADDVGLGKTIEAGLIARELLLRRKVKEIVVACPPSMLSQWQEELETRFGLLFAIMDREYLARMRQERGFGVNPWHTHTRFLISHRLLIDEQYAGSLRDWLGELRPGSLLILDEAHHAAPASGARYAIDSQITRSVRDLAPRFEHRLFLSATPHNGHSNSFSALLELLDPQRFIRGVPVKGKAALDAVMVRRLKEDIRELEGGFPRRVVRQVDIRDLPVEAPELMLSDLLDQYRQRRDERLAGATRRQQAAAGLLLCGLQQRLLSSIEAFARTLRVHCRTVARQFEEQRAAAPVSGTDHWDLLAESVDRDHDRAALAEDDLSAEEDAQFEAATLAAAGPASAGQSVPLSAAEQALLVQMTEIAQAHRHLPDARIRALVDWIRVHQCPELPLLGTRAQALERAAWNQTRVLIFTEYEDTRRYLVEQLTAAIADTDRADERIAVFTGSTPAPVRDQLKRAFNTDPAKHPVRILVATDAAREGLNLQTHCWNLFHFDVPWNPSRMEQRNGRIDRKLQPHGEVVCHYFVYHQRPEDRVLQVVVRKTDTIRKELGSLSPVLEGRLTDLLKGGISRPQINGMVHELEQTGPDPDSQTTVEAELEETRERQDGLRLQIDQLRTRLQASQQWIGLSEEHFRAALACGLELLGAEPLVPLTGVAAAADASVPVVASAAAPRGAAVGAEGRAVAPGAAVGSPTRYRFPALDQRQAADPTWADTLDSLRAPRPREQRYWDWRREAKIRPVVFADPGTMDDEVVHLHLEHRVVQRLLSRFAAQGFVYHDLTRACLAQTADAIPRVVLLGRLCLYGPGAARLHEELVPLAARWIDPRSRRGALAPYGREAQARTLDLLEDSLLPAHQRPVSEAVVRQLQTAADRDVTELRPHLEEHGRHLAEVARTRLMDRGEREAQAMQVVLAGQQKRLIETMRRHQDPNLSLQFDQDERRQLESNQRHWDKRLAALDHELAVEPERIRHVYQIRAQRLEPLGLVYLWPVTG